MRIPHRKVKNYNDGSPTVSIAKGWLFTGIVDSNGVDIYEGDIVADTCNYSRRSHVTYHDGAFWAGDVMLADCGGDELKVVGHIAADAVKKCEFCGRILANAVRTTQRFCSTKCRDAAARKKENYRKEFESKTLDDWCREAEECRLDYGNYRALREAGKTFEELKARADFVNQSAHSHLSPKMPVGKRF